MTSRGVGSPSPNVSVPRDHCPYLRPFPAGFSSCAAYQPQLFIGLDSQQKPLPPVWTCRNLAAGDNHAGGHYARCRLGDAAARERWVERVTSSRVDLMRALRREFAEFSRPYMQAILAAKARQVKHQDAAISAALRRVSDEFLDAAETHLQQRSNDLDRAGVPLDVARQIVTHAVDHWVRGSSAPVFFEVPEQLLKRLPETARRLLKPEPA